MKLLDIVTAPWAIEPEKLVEIREIYLTHLRGEKIDFAALEARGIDFKGGQQPQTQVVNGVAIVPMLGVMSKRANLMSNISGAASTQLVARELQAAAENRDVRAIMLQVDSPGGTVDGVETLTQSVARAARAKPLAVFGEGAILSAAYWAASGADAIYLSSTLDTAGSIGVVATHVDKSKLQETAGVKVTEITAGKYKRIASENAPLSQEGRAVMQETVDYLYSLFVDTVAKARGVSPQEAVERMADGQVFIGQRAVAAGLIDQIVGFDDLVRELANGHLPGVRSGKTSVQVGALAAKASAGVAQPNPTLLEINAMEEITLDVIKANYADIADQLRAEGRAQELSRIRGVADQSIPGYEAMINTMMFDGKTTAEQAAVALLREEKTKRASALQQMDAQAPAAVSPAAHEGCASAAAASAARFKQPAGGLPVSDSRADLHARATALAASRNIPFIKAVEELEAAA